MASVGTDDTGIEELDLHTARSQRSELNHDKQAEREEELFTSWNTNTVSSILSDVRRFESQVFANIEKQLDYLRRRQSSLFFNVEELSGNVTKLTDNMELVNSIVDRNSVYRSRRTSMGNSQPGQSMSGNRNSSVDFSAAAAAAVSAVANPTLNTIEESAPSADVSGLQTELQELRSDFDELRNQFHNNHTLDNRFKALEEWIVSQFKDQSRKIDNLHDMLNSQKAVQDKILERLDTMDQDMQSRMEAMGQDLENKIQALEYSQLGISKDIDVKLHGVSDILSIHDLRAKGIESKAARVSGNVDELKEQHDQLQTRYFDQIYASINELYADKASKEDLNIKADLTLALSKADQSDIDRLQGIADELQRRLIALLAETTDKVNAMDAKLDRRSDRIVTYCLKELKKEFRHLKNTGGDGGDDAPDGTNIGRVRCLVCNHVSTQHRDQDVVHSQHEKLTHSLKHLRPRSPSPGGNGGSPPMSPDHHNKPTSTFQQQQQQQQTIQRPGTAGTSSNLRPLATEDNDEAVDFRYRTGHGSSKLPTIQQQQNLAQAAPLIQIISHHLPVDVKMHQAQQLQKQQQQQQQMSLKHPSQQLRLGSTMQPQGSNNNGGTTMFSHTANAVVVKAAEMYPTHFSEASSPATQPISGHSNNNNNNNSNNQGISSSNAALSRPKSAPPKRV